MLTKSNIPYFDRNWGPGTGCSFGCPECYAAAAAHRFGKDFKPTFHPERLGDPAKRKKPTTIGVCFHGDLFDGKLPYDAHTRAFYAALDAPQHTYIFLTKRAADLAQILRDWLNFNAFSAPPNWYMGVTVRNRPELAAAAKYIRAMAEAGWKVWLSIEPMQGPVSLRWLETEALRNRETGSANHLDFARLLSGVILGGQSGPKAPPLHADWVRQVRDQCEAANVAFMFKQWPTGQAVPLRSSTAKPPCLDGRTHTALAWPLHEKVLP